MITQIELLMGIFNCSFKFFSDAVSKCFQNGATQKKGKEIFCLLERAETSSVISFAVLRHRYGHKKEKKKFPEGMPLDLPKVLYKESRIKSYRVLLK